SSDPAARARRPSDAAAGSRCGCVADHDRRDRASRAERTGSHPLRHSSRSGGASRAAAPTSRRVGGTSRCGRDGGGVRRRGDRLAGSGRVRPRDATLAVVRRTETVGRQATSGGVGWSEAPAVVRTQLASLVDGLRSALGERALGVYVHGSLALGSFSPARSDLDVLAVVDEALDTDAKLLVADLLLRVSCAPYPIELHVLTRAQLRTWRHPSPFELHYGEGHREGFALDPLDRLATMSATDADLAAHLTVARKAGIA